MRAFKSRKFAGWASGERLTDSMLWAALEEMERGLVDANLGGHVYKKRIALAGRGKRGGARTLVVYRAAEVAFFEYGFAKKDRDNISEEELGDLKELAKDLLNYSPQELDSVIESGEHIEVKRDEGDNI